MFETGAFFGEYHKLYYDEIVFHFEQEIVFDIDEEEYIIPMKYLRDLDKENCTVLVHSTYYDKYFI